MFLETFQGQIIKYNENSFLKIEASLSIINIQKLFDIFANVSSANDVYDIWVDYFYFTFVQLSSDNTSELLKKLVYRTRSFI